MRDDRLLGCCRKRSPGAALDDVPRRSRALSPGTHDTGSITERRHAGMRRIGRLATAGSWTPWRPMFPATIPPPGSGP